MRFEVNEELYDLLLGILPHGNGIDYDYTITTSDRVNKIYIENAWHYMNDNGMYDGVLPFTVIVSKDSIIVQFHVNRAGRYRVNKAGLKDYLEELYFDILVDKVKTLF